MLTMNLLSLWQKTKHEEQLLLLVVVVAENKSAEAGSLAMTVEEEEEEEEELCDCPSKTPFSKTSILAHSLVWSLV